jgi:hypothetical protein
MVEHEEGMDFVDIFKGRYSSREGTDKRLKAERIAGMSAKQRGARKPAKVQVNFRATAETKALLEGLAGHLDKSVTDVVELAVAELAKSIPGFRGK